MEARRLCGAPAMTRAEQCRSKAEECERGAQQVCREEIKQLYRDLARHWLELAERAEWLSLRQ
jgi:hypothetical protein